MKIWPTGRGAKRKRASLLGLLAVVALTVAEALAPGVLPPELRDVVAVVLGL